MSVHCTVFLTFIREINKQTNNVHQLWTSASGGFCIWVCRAFRRTSAMQTDNTLCRHLFRLTTTAW